MYIYNAALYCDDCADLIKSDLDNEGCEDWGDSDGYPQWCSDSDESDCPEHCDECGEFLGNSLTSDGADYVINAVREDMKAGRFDSVACTVWRDYYYWLDFPAWGDCDICGGVGELFEDCDYNECCEVCLNRWENIDPSECSGDSFCDSCTD
jgi:hypothetical protein